MTNNETPESLPPPKLTVSRAEAAQKIEARLEKLYEIDTPFELDNWTDYTTELLNRLFNNSSVARQFMVRRLEISTAPFFFSRGPERNSERIEGSFFEQEKNNDIRFLKSLLEKLELIPEPVQANTTSTPSAQQAPLSREIFIVHGHDEAAKEAVARVLSQLDLKPIILNEKADAGLTVIEKFEKHANVAFAVVLLTPDDIGCAKKEPDQQKPRARQNVILEFGYFLGRLGRGKVCALYKEGVELPPICTASSTCRWMRAAPGSFGSPKN